MKVAKRKAEPPDVDSVAEIADARIFVSMAPERTWKTRAYRYGRALISRDDWVKIVEAKLDKLAKDCERDRRKFLDMIRRLADRVESLEKRS